MSQVSFDFEKSMEPTKAIAALNLKNIEKFVSFNVELYTKYTAIALDNTKEAMSITDVEAAQAFITKQSEKSKEAVDTLVSDANVVVEMGKEYSEELKTLLTDMGEKATETVKAAAPAPALEAKKPEVKKPAAKKPAAKKPAAVKAA